MNPRLRFALDNTDNPKLISILAEMAKLDDKTQGVLLDAIEAGLFDKDKEVEHD